MIRALSLLLPLSACTVPPELSRAARDVFKAQRFEGGGGPPHDAAGRARRNAAIAEQNARFAETEARWKRKAEAKAAAEARQRAAAQRELAKLPVLLRLEPDQARELTRRCPETAYLIMHAQGVRGVSDPTFIGSKRQAERAGAAAMLGLGPVLVQSRIEAVRQQYQECSRESLYHGPAWVAPWPITAEPRRGG
jgi:hypothetical protein